jgi:hypothetical protein
VSKGFARNVLVSQVPTVWFFHFNPSLALGFFVWRIKDAATGVSSNDLSDLGPAVQNNC